MNKKQRKAAQKAAKKHPVLIGVIIAALIIAIVAAVAFMYFKKIGPFAPKETVLSGEEAEISGAELSIHFLELGNASAGDSILIDCGDTEVLIDAGSDRDSAPTVNAYINKYCADGKLEYVIMTHGDTDHIAAFIGQNDDGVLYEFEVGTIVRFGLTNKDTAIMKKLLARVDELEEGGTKVYKAGDCYNEKDGAKRQYFLNSSATVSINFLYNKYYYEKHGTENNYSVVTLLTYESSAKKQHFLFTGDLEKVGEDAMADYYSDPSNSKSAYDVLPEVELFKAGHHGSPTSSNEKLLSVIKPKNVVVCCCAGAPEYTTNPANVFPSQEAIDRLSKYTENIYVTTLATDIPEIVDGKFTKMKSGYSHASMNGNIVFYISDGLKLYCSENSVKLKDTEWFAKYRVWNA